MDSELSSERDLNFSVPVDFFSSDVPPERGTDLPVGQIKESCFRSDVSFCLTADWDRA